MPSARPFRASFYATALLGYALVGLAQPDTSAGLIVDRILPGSPAERAGLRVGDTLTDWRVEPVRSTDATPAGGALLEWIDLRRAEIEQAARGPVTLGILREDQPLTLTLDAIQWGIGVESEPDGDSLTVIDTPVPSIAALLWTARADALERAGDFAGAEHAWESVLEARAQYEPHASLGRVHAMYMLGTLRRRAGDLDASGDLLEQAHEQVTTLAPGSLLEAQILTALGVPAALTGDLDAAEAHFQRALDIVRAIDPEAGEAGAALNALGNVAQRRGRLAEAERYYLEALAISERIELGSLNSSFQLNNLGFIAELRGNLAGAEDYYRRSLAIRRERAPNTIHLPRAIENLGFVALLRGDLAAAEAYHREALPLYEALAPGSLVVANSLKLIANVNLERGTLDEAENYFERARELEAAVAPDTGSYAEILHGLARTAERRGDLDRAETYYTEALIMRERIAPGGLEVAESLERLGALVLMKEDYAVAEQRLIAAVSIRERLAPGTAEHAEALHALATVYRATTRPSEALSHFEAALAAIEAHRGRLGGTDVVRSRFAARYGHLYKDTIAMQLELDRPTEAFNVLERYRARGLLAMLAERDLLLDEDLPADVVTTRAALNAEYDDTTMQLRALAETPELAAQIDALRARLGILQDEREQLGRRIREFSPRLAALESPEPLDLAAVHRELAPGTTLLSSAVDVDRSWLFALHKSAADDTPELHVYPIALGSQALAEEVNALRLLMQAPGAGDLSRQALLARAHSLYRALIEPAADLVARSDRLLIIPDGPLQQLAFAALVVDPGDSERRPRYLVEERPINTAVSATLHAEVRSAGGAVADAMGAAPQLIAFADPLAAGSGADAGEDAVAVAMLRGRSLGALPYARREVESIAGLIGDRAELHVGRDASERRAKAIGRHPRVLHFASHAVTDTIFPLDSYLLLAPSDGNGEPPENGLLQAWEIFEQMRIDADLVTLSACDTGLGSDGGGEGLIGLTRAFHYAGARAVLASLWPVSDRSTSELMHSFYAGYERGLAKDEALRAAQLAQIQSGDRPGLFATLGKWFGHDRAEDLSHPFHWAAFQISGDAR